MQIQQNPQDLNNVQPRQNHFDPILDAPLERYFERPAAPERPLAELTPQERRERIIRNARRLGRIAFVDTTTIARANAQDAGIQQYRREMDDINYERATGQTREGESIGIGRRVSNWARRLWKGNLAREYYEDRNIRTHTSQAITNRDTHHGTGYDVITQRQENTALADRFCHDMGALIRTDLGERAISLDNTDDNRWHEGIAMLKQRILYTARQYVENAGPVRFTPAQFEAQIHQHVQELREYARQRGLDISQVFDSGQVFVSNISRMVRVLEEARNHQVAFDDLGLRFDVVIGRARSAVVEGDPAHQSRQDAFERMKSSPIGAIFANETVVPAALVVAANLITRKTAFVLGGLGLGVAASGAIAYAQESKRLRRERIEDTRSRGKGLNPNNTGPARGEMIGRTMVDMRPAHELIYLLDQSINELVRLDAYDPGRTDPQTLAAIRLEAREKFEAAVGALADAEIRMRILAGRESLVGDPDQTPEQRQAFRQVVQWSRGRENQERLQLEVALAQARRNLETYGSDTQNNAVLNYDSQVDGSHIDQTVQTRIDDTYTTAEGTLRQGISERDVMFNAERKKRARNVALNTIGWGLVGGAAVQEAIAFVNPNVQGLLERGIRGNNPDVVASTMLGKAYDMFAGNNKSYAMGGGQAFVVGDGTHAPVRISLPAEYTYHDNMNGTYDVCDPTGQTVLDDFRPVFDSNGRLTVGSMAELRDIPGVNTIEQSVNIPVRGYDGFRSQHPGIFQTVEIVDHWDNNTGASFDSAGNVIRYGSDGAELMLERAGAGGTGVEIAHDGSRTYVMSIRDMIGQVSTDDGRSLDIGEAIRTGHVRVMMYGGMEDHVHGRVEGVMADVDRNGMVRIPAGSPAGQFWHIGADGRAHWYGQLIVQENLTTGDDRYATIARSFGDSWDGYRGSMPVVNIGAEMNVARGMQGAYLPLVGRDTLRPVDAPPVRQPWRPTPLGQSGVFRPRMQDDHIDRRVPLADNQGFDGRANLVDVGQIPIDRRNLLETNQRIEDTAESVRQVIALMTQQQQQQARVNQENSRTLNTLLESVARIEAQQNANQGTT